MRRMRDIPWYIYLLILPVVAAPFGIRSLVHKWRADPKIVKPVEYSVTIKKSVETKQVRALPSVLPTLPMSGGQCTVVEFRGEGPEKIKIKREQWARVMDAFHGAKRGLIAWLADHKAQIPPQVRSVMEAQVKNLRIQRPPAQDDLDLAWRGIGIWTLDSDGPLIRVGGGFVTLFEKDPLRGRFEIARLVAQSWAPCELERLKVESPWNDLLKCLGVEEPMGCTVGSYSEGGWAVASAVANVVAPPGCRVPAFADPKTGLCLKNMFSPMKEAGR